MADGPLRRSDDFSGPVPLRGFSFAAGDERPAAQFRARTPAAAGVRRLVRLLAGVAAV